MIRKRGVALEKPIDGSRGAGSETGLSGTNLERAGDHNQRVTLHAIRINGPITRTDLAELTGLTLPAIANITRRLREDNLILEAGRDYGARGQPPTRLVINPDGRYAIGVNVDRDHLTMVLLDFAGNVRTRISREIEFALPRAVRAFFRKSVQTMITRAGIDPADVAGVGVALPDDVHRVRLTNQPDSYTAWADADLQSLFAEPFGFPVIIENDAAAAALGEMQFGLGHRFRSFFYVLITVGLGGGVVIDGHYFRGTNGRSGELGWIRHKDPSGQVRQLQEVVSLSALRLYLERHGHTLDSPAALSRLDPPATLSVRRWVDEAANSLVDAMLSISCLLDPEAVLIGGRLPADLLDQLADKLNRLVADRRRDIPWAAPILRAQLSDDAAAVGAGTLPFSAEFLPSRAALLKSKQAATA